MSLQMSQSVKRKIPNTLVVEIFLSHWIELLDFIEKAVCGKT